MKRSLADALPTVERLVVTVAAGLAIFPLYQYWSEADDRARERAVREAQLGAICVDYQRNWENVLKESGVSEVKEGVILKVKDIPPWKYAAVLTYCRDLGFISKIAGRP